MPYVSWEGKFTVERTKEGGIAIVLGKGAYTLTLSPEAAIRLGTKLRDMGIVVQHEERFGK